MRTHKKNSYTQQTYSNITTVLNDKRTYRKTDRLNEKKIQIKKNRTKKQWKLNRESRTKNQYVRSHTEWSHCQHSNTALCYRNVDAFPQIPIICARVTIKFHPSITITRLIVCVFSVCSFCFVMFVMLFFLYPSLFYISWYFYFILSSCFVFTRINKTNKKKRNFGIVDMYQRYMFRTCHQCYYDMYCVQIQESDALIR